MSSWLNKTIPPKRQVPKEGYYFESRQVGFCSVYLDYFYSYLFTQNKKTKLLVNDLPNAVNINWNLLKETFGEKPGVEFLREKTGKEISTELRRFLSSSPITQGQGRDFFSLSPSIKKECDLFLSYFPNIPKFDIGIHIRSGDKIKTGEMKEIPIQLYLQEIRKHINSNSPTIFVMTDNYKKLEELQKLANPEWTFVTFASKEINGHDQNNFNLMKYDDRKSSYIQFLTELEIMKQIPILILTFSSNIGRYLYLTSSAQTNIVSLDVKNFYAI